jgi:hypothetical protein
MKQRGINELIKNGRLRSRELKALKKVTPSLQVETTVVRYYVEWRRDYK